MNFKHISFKKMAERMNLKGIKSKTFLLAALAICAAIIATGTWAFFVDEDIAHNVITTNGIDVSLDEKQDTDGDGVPDQDWPEEGVTDVMPGTTTSKIVKVTNDRTEERTDAWIRVKVTMSITTTDDEGNEVELPLHITVKDKDTGEESIIPVLALSGLDTENWVCEDGYFYYTEPVEPMGETTVLFTGVYFERLAGNEYQDCTINVYVYAEAVQVVNNLIPDGGDVTDIQGWPVTEGGYVGTTVNGAGEPIAPVAEGE